MSGLDPQEQEAIERAVDELRRSFGMPESAARDCIKSVREPAGMPRDWRFYRGQEKYYKEVLNRHRAAVAVEHFKATVRRSLVEPVLGLFRRPTGGGK